MLIFQRWIIVRRSEAVDPEERHVDQSALIRGKRYSAQTKSLRYVRVGVELLLGEVSVVVTETEFVDQVRIKDVGFAGRQVLRQYWRKLPSP